MNPNPETHTPVMLKEVLETLKPAAGLYVDATFGRGGYTRALLEASPDTQVIAIDRDAEAIAWGAHHLSTELNTGRLTLIHARFSSLGTLLTAPIQGVVFDFGLSSPQIQTPERGFSFMHAGPLTMDMGLSDTTAADIVNTWSEEDLADLIHTFGEERKARTLAKKIVAERQIAPFQSTQQLATLIASVVPSGKRHLHPATRTFQALRIAVNQELDEISTGLEGVLPHLAPGGRVVTVAFHSLEDRIVKHFFSGLSTAPPAPSRYAPPQQPLSFQPKLQVRGKQPLFPQTEETKANPRARSARLRWAVRTEVA